jgi:cellulose synthase/poly-beta-1,6-N-acetylglucosamine synthase-like glycosyltransferase
MSDGSMAVLLGLTQAIALTMSVAFLAYVYVIVVPYLRHTPVTPADSRTLSWHFLVPCRDEEAVVGGTVRYLRETFPRAQVWVIDDDSDDRTAEIVEVLRRRHGRLDPALHLVRRVQPQARTGKGDALNAAYQAVLDRLGVGVDADRQILVVVDADGRPAPNCLGICAAESLFGDAGIGAVQVDVRMSNRDTPAAEARGLRRRLGALLVRMQDLEFRTAIAAIQKSRGYTGTISMGGNGQFARLSALRAIAGPDNGPWRGSLLEDFELGVHLLTEGWRTGFTMDTHVDQEGLYSLRRFLAQRTRWGQGTMQCVRYVRLIWDSKHVSTLGATEMLYYLAQPWMQLLGTLIYPIPLLLLVFKTAAAPAWVWHWFTGGAWILFAVYGTFGLLPFLVWGPIYWWKCERRVGFLRGLGYGLCYAAYIYTFYITSWRALIRLVRGNNGWSKTRRNIEPRDGVIALDH